MIKIGFVKLFVATALVTASAAVFADHHMKDKMDDSMGESEKMTENASMNIVESASKADSLSTLVAAIKAADLVETLSGSGPFTVFAPTNAAFEKLPEGTVETLLKPENKEKLKSILTYHVVAAKATSSAAMKMVKDDGGAHPATTVQGGEITLSLEGKSLMVEDANGNTAKVTKADMMQSNGVVHVIDTVLMP